MRLQRYYELENDAKIVHDLLILTNLRLNNTRSQSSIMNLENPNLILGIRVYPLS